DGNEVAAIVPVDSGDCVAHLTLHPVEPRVHSTQLVLEAKHLLDAGEVEPELGREALDQTQPREVVLRVEARVPGGALRAHEALLLVDAQRLRMHADELGGDGAHVEGMLVRRHPFTFWNSSSSSRLRLFSFLGTSMRTRART